LAPTFVELHPTQLYEAAFCFFLTVLLLAVFWRKPRPGTVAFVYFLIYPTGRFLFEFLRGDNAKVAYHLTLSQWLSVAIVAVALGSCFIFRFMRYDYKTNRRSA